MALKIDGTIVVDDDRNGFFPNLSFIEKPTNVSPPNNSSNVITFPLTISGSSYGHLYNVTHQTSLFEVSNANTFATVVYTSGNVAANTSNIVSVILNPNTEFFYRIKYKDSENVFSEFSDTTSFTTANAFINTPTLGVTGAPSAVNETPTLTTSAFSVSNNTLFSAAHVSTDWQVIRTSNSEIVFNRVANTTNLLSIVVPAVTLSANTTFEFKARHNANVLGSSAFASNTATTIASFFPTVLGQAFGGGFWTGISGSYYLVVAPNSVGCACCIWQSTGTIVAAFSDTDGFTNTYPHLTGASFPAGNFTATRTLNGFSDWYLPANTELQTLYNNKGSMPAGEGYPTTFPCLYWTSRDFSDGLQARTVLFSTGALSNSQKQVPYKVRAVRRVPF